MINVKNISKSFADNSVLKNVTINFEKGKTNLIIGRSGSGKTVLLKSIVGLHEIDEGEIWYGETLYNNVGSKKRKEIRKEIGMLFQGGALFDSATIEENVMYPLDMFTNKSYEEKLERTNLCLDRVKLENVNNLFPSEISGGMKKRAAIARAIAINPKYLFCDEPNSGLDPKTAIIIDNLIKEITEEYDTTTIINTHDMNSVMEIGDNISFISEGEICWQGNKNDILHTENEELNNFVFASKLYRKIKDL